MSKQRALNPKHRTYWRDYAVAEESRKVKGLDTHQSEKISHNP